VLRLLRGLMHSAMNSPVCCTRPRCDPQAQSSPWATSSWPALARAWQQACWPALWSSSSAGCRRSLLAPPCRSPLLCRSVNGLLPGILATPSDTDTHRALQRLQSTPGLACLRLCRPVSAAATAQRPCAAPLAWSLPPAAGVTPAGAQGAPTAYRGPLDVVRHVLAERGVGGLFRGMAPTLVREVTGTAIMFAVFEGAKRRLADAQVGAPENRRQKVSMTVPLPAELWSWPQGRARVAVGRAVLRRHLPICFICGALSRGIVRAIRRNAASLQALPVAPMHPWSAPCGPRRGGPHKVAFTGGSPAPAWG